MSLIAFWCSYYTCPPIFVFFLNQCWCASLSLVTSVSQRSLVSGCLATTSASSWSSCHSAKDEWRGRWGLEVVLPLSYLHKPHVANLTATRFTFAVFCSGHPSHPWYVRLCPPSDLSISHQRQGTVRIQCLVEQIDTESTVSSVVASDAVTALLTFPRLRNNVMPQTRNSLSASSLIPITYCTTFYRHLQLPQHYDMRPIHIFIYIYR